MTFSQSRPLLDIEAVKLQNDFSIIKNQAVFMITPTFEAQEWHYKRSVFYSKALAVDQKINFTGAKYNGTSDYIVWSHDIEDSTLYITHLKARNRQSFQSLLLAAVAEAKKWNFKYFELWDPSKVQQQWAKEINSLFCLIKRTKNLSSLAFWGASLKENERLEWKLNEQHCWVPIKYINVCYINN
jgi:hypothetical protein